MPDVGIEPVWFKAQRVLSRGQRCPVFGIFPSIGKLGLGLGQLVIGGGLALIGTFALMCSPQSELHVKGWSTILCGGISIGYAVGNICTLSLMGYVIEGAVSDVTQQ